MRKMYLLIVLFLLIGLSNCKDNEIAAPTNFGKGEISFSNSKTSLSDMSYSFGIESLTNASLLNDSEFKFTILGSASFVNGQEINLNNSEVVLTKRGLTSYSIFSNISAIGEIRLSIDTESKQLSLVINDEELALNQLSSKQQLAIVLMTNFFNEATIKNNVNKVNKGGRIQKEYYGYTVGWGLTAEEAVDHEKDVRAGASGSISDNGCKYIGTSTSCVFGSIGCTTISTFKCTGPTVS